MKTFYTTDSHFGHGGKEVNGVRNGGIIKFSKRPFANIEEHDEALIERWNSVVGKNDRVIHGGDFLIGNVKRVPSIVERLNGQIFLALGNHDPEKDLRKLGVFADIRDTYWIREGEDRVFVSHYAHRFWKNSHHGSYHVYGHNHGSAPPHGRSLDVGVDCWDFTPVTFEQIKARLDGLGLLDVRVDHHAADDDAG